MCARFTVLSDTPIAAAIAGCVIPLSRNSTIWMRWRCAAGIFHRSAVFSRRTSALLHLTICPPESDGSSESHLNAEKQPVQPVSLPCPNRPDSRRYGAGISLHGSGAAEELAALKQVMVAEAALEGAVNEYSMRHAPHLLSISQRR